MTVDQVADRAHRAEILRRDLLAGVTLHFVHQVDHVDAVDLQVLVQPRLRRDVGSVELEQLDQRAADALEDFIVAIACNCLARVCRHVSRVLLSLAIASAGAV